MRSPQLKAWENHFDMGKLTPERKDSITDKLGVPVEERLDSWLHS